MKNWSKYNTLFQSERFDKHFLYNALSNVMLELDEQHYRLLENLRDRPQDTKIAVDTELRALLEANFILTDDNLEKNALLRKRYLRNSICFDSAHLDLTICPTLKCNFRCPYCFESSQDQSTVMSQATIDKIMAFIKRFTNARSLSVTWFGGEPTLSFNTITTLTKRFLGLELQYDKADMFTNGYLLDKDKIEQLNTLKIQNVQITLDGNSSRHDSRRVLVGNYPTFDKIIANVETLLNSTYKGRCTIRVNVDKTNMAEYTALRSELLRRFPSDKLSVYPAQVETPLSHRYDHSCTLCVNEWANFAIGLYFREGVLPVKGFYPNNNASNTCVANNQNGFVIGSEGELYKCWGDIGKDEMVIGSVYDKEPVTNVDLVSMYSIGTDPYEDAECVNCSVLPICGGGCVNKRLRAHHFKEGAINFCSPYRDNLIAYLEAFYDVLTTKEVCASILGTPTTANACKGYRVLQSQTFAA